MIDSEKELIAYINATPSLMSLLYDINLLPELPLDSTQKRHMLLIAVHWRERERRLDK